MPKHKETVWMVGDLHLGHKRIPSFRDQGEWSTLKTCEEHAEHILSRWDALIGKKDKVFLLGDVAMSSYWLSRLEEMKGYKHLIKGNHDNCKAEKYLKVFPKIDGIIQYQGCWITHAPVHPAELRGRPNIHGHVHQQSIKLPVGSPDTRYINACVETASFDQPFHNMRDLRPLIAKAREII